MLFTEFSFSSPILKSIRQQGYQEPTKIQQLSFPHVLEGKDVMGCAQTGTGKTAAFALPILQRLGRAKPARGPRRIRVLALAPTRELASQIGQSFNDYGRNVGTRTTVIFGGVNQNPQVRTLQSGVDILVATPGRLLDLMNQGYVDLTSVEYLVLDEADRMLDMGFIHDIRRVIATVPKQRQTLLFSATLPPSIVKLANGILTDPITVSVTPPATTVESIDQSVFFVEKPNKINLLVHMLDDQDISRALVFTRTKHGADKVVRKLGQAGITAAAIHGNKSQNRREQALSDFKTGVSRVLVATDIASRGLDIDQVTHVFNFDLPADSESYVHRIGRTGRAGASGIAFSFCSQDERSLLASIERLIRRRILAQKTPQLSYRAPVVPQNSAESQAKAQAPRPSGRPGRRKPSGGSSRSSRPEREGGAPHRRSGNPSKKSGSNGGRRSNRFGEYRPRRSKSGSAGRSDSTTSRG